MVKILYISYAKAEFKQVSNNANQLNVEEITQLLRILEYFEDFFDGTLGDWYTYPIDLELKLGSKPFNSKYYPVPELTRRPFAKSLNA